MFWLDKVNYRPREISEISDSLPRNIINNKNNLFSPEQSMNFQILNMIWGVGDTGRGGGGGSGPSTRFLIWDVTRDPVQSPVWHYSYFCIICKFEQMVGSAGSAAKSIDWISFCWKIQNSENYSISIGPRICHPNPAPSVCGLSEFYNDNPPRQLKSDSGRIFYTSHK